jgi:predicted PurR-regulated permease PerM
VATAERTLRVTVGAQPMVVVLVALAAATATFGVVTSSTRILGWAVACAVIAAVIEPLVTLLDRWLPRLLAILLALIGVGVAGVSIAGGVLADLGNQFDRIRVEAPRAAAELEDSERFGEVARDLRLQERIDDLIERLDEPTSGLASQAPTTTSTYFVCAILVAFFLSWGPRLGQAGLEQIADESSRARARLVGSRAFSRARRYILFAIARASFVGVVAWAACYAENVPAPIVLGVTIGALSAVTGFGILVGCLPALLLAGGLESGTAAARLALVFALLQAIDILVLRYVVAPRSLSVGPAAIVIAFVVGFEVYGVGGAFYGAALAVLGVALLDAAGEAEAARTASTAAD